MPSTSVAEVSLPRLPVKDRPKRNQAITVRGKLKAAIEFIVFDGKPLDEAAKAADLTTYALRQALGKPHVVAHLKARRVVLRESICGSNIRRLGQIRDAADNMPAIQAIRTLEQMGDDPLHAASSASASPGMTIRIVNVVQALPTADNPKHGAMIEVTHD